MLVSDIWNKYAGPDKHQVFERSHAAAAEHAKHPNIRMSSSKSAVLLCAVWVKHRASISAAAMSEAGKQLLVLMLG